MENQKEQNQNPTISDEAKDRAEARFLADKRSKAWFLGQNLRPYPCKKCGLFGCVCQSNLIEWQESKPKFLRDVCPTCELYLCDCPKDASGRHIPK